MIKTIHSPLRATAFVFLWLTVFVVANSSYSFDGKNPANPAPSSTEMMRQRNFISGYAQNFTGVPYVHAGNSPSKGFDCSGFTSYILHEFEVDVSKCSATQSQEGKRIALDEVQPGDLVFFGRRGRIQHVAMVVECTAEGIVCVHSTSSRGVVVENISTSTYWRPRILFARDVISKD